MSRVSGATVQQSTPVSSSVAMAEEKEVQTETKKESKKVESHSLAQKQNAVARQQENNLSAMLQKEQFKTIPRAHIPKEDVEALVRTLNSGKEAAEEVKEELTAAFKNNGPGQHAKIAECMREFAAVDKGSYDAAYNSLKEEMGNWLKFDRTGQAPPSQRNFFKEVANLSGPGSARVKADVALMIQNNIEQAKKEPAGSGLRAFAGMFTGELGKMLQSEPTGIFRAFEHDLKMQEHVPGMIDNLLNFREGHKALGELVVDMTLSTSRSILKSPDQNRDEAYLFGRFMAQVEKGIERNAKTREETIEKGASIVTYGLKAAELLLPKEAKEGFGKVKEGIEWLKKRDLDSVEETRKHLISNMYKLVDTTFQAGAEKYTPQYDHAMTLFQREYMQGRRDAIDRESLR
jgi:hypothetical protein